jgi:hypothetical protein
MKKIINIILIFLVLTLLLFPEIKCCKNETNAQENKKDKLELLAKRNGCKLYRYDESAYYVYVCICPSMPGANCSISTR